MSDNQNQPREFDAVLGGQALPPPSLVLGGLEGVKRRLTSSVIEVQVAALSDALSYGEAGLELVIQALPNSSQQLQRVASLLLREKGGDIGKQALLDYDPWLFFTTLQSSFMADSPIIDNLVVLDLSMGNLTDDGLEALLECAEINNLHTLNISNNCISEDFLEQIEQFSPLNCSLIADFQ